MVLIVHPSAELYGSDRVALESARAFLEAGWQVEITVTAQGPLVALLREAGCSVSIQPAPVLRKAYLSPLGLLRFAVQTARCTPAMIRLLRRTRPTVVYVSTVTVPWWLVLARFTGSRVMAHVHEAEDAIARPLRVALAAPLLLAHRVVANSQASLDIVVQAVPALARRCEVIYNGVPGPATCAPAREDLQAPVRLVLVGRISPRKGTDVAVTALAVLHERQVRATLNLVGGVFPGYEWFEDDVRALVSAQGLEGAVTWSGVLPDVWAALQEADIALVPSRVEPFGNAAVEAMLAQRPVIAGDAQGLREIIRSAQDGELVTAGDATALAEAVLRTIGDWPGARARAGAARIEADDRFSPAQYRRRIAAALNRVR